MTKAERDKADAEFREAYRRLPESERMWAEEYRKARLAEIAAGVG